MQLNIAHKIFGIATIVLLLMLAVAVYSVQQIAKISADLETIVERQIPVADNVARINVKVLEQGVLLQRLFVFAEEATNDAQAAQQARERMRTLGADVEQQFEDARRILATIEGRTKAQARILETQTTLGGDLDAIEREYRNFEAHALLLLQAREVGDRTGFSTLLEKLNVRQDAIFKEIATLRRHVEDLTNGAVVRADHEERSLLIANILLTSLASVLGLGFAAIVTRYLVTAVRRLVTGTESVEAGNLDTEVPITTADEIGRLTGSFNGMVGGLRMKERIKDTFGKYMDPRIVSNLLNHPEFSEPGGERREMTVMFIDLKGFTSISEALPADQLVHTINGFFTHMTEAISDTNGVVDKFMGDAVMAYWGPPFTEPNEHAALACKAATKALLHLEKFRAEVADELGADTVEIDLRIGISTGEMVVGTIGSTASRSFTVMGDPVNLGSRLEGANKAYGTRIMISERTRELAGTEISVRELDLIRVKGKETPTRVFELMASNASDGHLALPGTTSFETGLVAYRNQDWEAAETAFNEFLMKQPNDSPSQVYLSRVDQLKAMPPGADWDGVWVFDTK